MRSVQVCYDNSPQSANSSRTVISGPGKNFSFASSVAQFTRIARLNGFANRYKPYNCTSIQFPPVGRMMLLLTGFAA